MNILRYEYEGATYEGFSYDGVIIANPPLKGISSIKIQDVRLLAPVKPSKIVCAGLNYHEHAKELGMSIPKEPVIFIKPPTAVIGHNADILFPPDIGRIDFEGELAVVIGKMARNVPSSKAREYILGYTCFNDVTARDLQKRDGQWTRSKSFDTFAPLGPLIKTEIDPFDLEIKTFLNGNLMQDSRTSDLIFNVYELIEFISGIMTLLPGDIIATGTPGGIGPMHPGDEVVVDIRGIGKLMNRAALASVPSF